MNLVRSPIAAMRHAFRIWLDLRKFLPKQKCRSFGAQSSGHWPGIEKIFVINLDREPVRWAFIEKELKHLMNPLGGNLFDLTERYAAIDAKNFVTDPPKDAFIDPFYTLGDQLYVEPQPLTLPTRYELDAPIRMSRAEIAVARSHINVWRQVAESENSYSLILEDDVWFHSGFGRILEIAWREIASDRRAFDVLYVSYLEVKYGAPKASISSHLFRPERGLWHLSGYVLSREGAQKLLRLLPCRGPVDLWINHQFDLLNVLATKNSLISQRFDSRSSNSYSILPALSSIGAINSESASLFNNCPTTQPVFVFGPEGSGHSSLAMALSMLGYRCCSDLQSLPAPELSRLLEGSEDRIFDAYVNIGSLCTIASELRTRYPKAKFILTADSKINAVEAQLYGEGGLSGADILVFDSTKPRPWQAICEHLRCSPPSCAFPKMQDIGQRKILDGALTKDSALVRGRSRHDKSPWVVEHRSWWHGIHSISTELEQRDGEIVKINDQFVCLDEALWASRSDTFTDNLALFRPSNVEFNSGGGIALSVKKEQLGVRGYSGASLCSRHQYLFGRFEAIIQASNTPGVITGFFLHRNLPRQEIDIEITGNRPDRLLVNVFYNPGGEDANFDYGYRGTPTYIELGFDASKAMHSFVIEWSPSEIRWLVDGKLVHRRLIWDPTPIPHLPMTLHLNSWPTRSEQLAGRINDRLLPSTARVGSINLTANRVGTLPTADEIPPSTSTVSLSGVN